MIATELYDGQGFGNQLWVYAVTRCIAERKGFDYAILSSKRFKGSGFLSLDFGLVATYKPAKSPKERDSESFPKYLLENLERNKETNLDISPADARLIGVEDGTLFDGIMQSTKYIESDREKIAEWFKVKVELFKGCVINLRGGEYKRIQNVFLSVEYYKFAIKQMQKIDPEMKFLVVTDDKKLAKEYFPDYPIVSSGGVKIFLNKFYFSPPSKKIGKDFGFIQNAEYLILSNSSFSWWGAWTNKSAKKVIAPKYWAAHNVSDGYWSTGEIHVPNWDWIAKTNYLGNEP